MPRLAPAPLQLADPEREALHALINRHSTAQQIALRGRIRRREKSPRDRPSVED
jgi:putative transposase